MIERSLLSITKDASSLFLFFSCLRMGTKTKYKETCSYHCYHLRNYKGFKDTIQEPGMKTNIYIYYIIMSHCCSSFQPFILDGSCPTFWLCLLISWYIIKWWDNVESHILKCSSVYKLVIEKLLIAFSINVIILRQKWDSSHIILLFRNPGIEVKFLDSVPNALSQKKNLRLGRRIWKNLSRSGVKRFRSEIGVLFTSTLWVLKK